MTPQDDEECISMGECLKKYMKMAKAAALANPTVTAGIVGFLAGAFVVWVL